MPVTVARIRFILCHINMLKPYVNKLLTVLGSVRAETPHTSVDGLMSDIKEEDYIAAPSGAVVQGRLKNCEMLAELYKCF